MIVQLGVRARVHACVCVCVRNLNPSRHTGWHISFPAVCSYPLSFLCRSEVELQNKTNWSWFRFQAEENQFDASSHSVVVTLSTKKKKNSRNVLELNLITRCSENTGISSSFKNKLDCLDVYERTNWVCGLKNPFLMSFLGSNTNLMMS